MASIISAGTTSATALNMSADTTGVLSLASNNGVVALTINTSGNVGVGTTSPGSKLQIVGDVVASNFYFGASSGVAGTIGATSTGSGASISMYGSTASPPNTAVFNTSTGEQARFDNTGITAKQFLTAGTVYGSQSTVDVTSSTVTLANNGFIDNVSFSGMFVLNNWTTGGVSIWLCGGGNVSQVSQVSGGAGMSVAYNAGISGYTIQNLTGSTVIVGLFKVRTRTAA